MMPTLGQRLIQTYYMREDLEIDANLKSSYFLFVINIFHMWIFLRFLPFLDT